MHSAQPDNPILYVNFNQDATCIGVGSRKGYRIYNCNPFEKCFHVAEGGIGICEMLFCTSLVALVGAGDQPAFSPRRLRVWNTKDQSPICDLNFVTAVLKVQLNRQRMVVVLEQKIHIFNINTMQILETLDTIPNPKGLCVLSSSDNSYLAFPTGSHGEVLVYDANNLSVLNAIPAHRTAPVALAFDSKGELLATASESGTIIRVFRVPEGMKVATFRRGAYKAMIYAMAFNSISTVLCASSDTGTIHIFSLTGKESSVKGSCSKIAALSESAGLSGQVEKKASLGMGAYIPESFSQFVEGARDFAFARLRTPGIPNLCALKGPEQGETVVELLVVTVDGFFYQYEMDISKGGECRLIRENMLQESVSEAIAATYLG